MFTDDEVRMLGLSAPQFLKMLSTREARVLNRIYGEFRAGKADLTRDLAEWACIRSQIEEVKNVLAQHHKQETKRHESAATDGE